MCKIEKTSFFSKIDRFFASTDADALTIFKNIVEKFCDYNNSFKWINNIVKKAKV